MTLAVHGSSRPLLGLPGGVLVPQWHIQGVEKGWLPGLCQHLWARSPRPHTRVLSVRPLCAAG